ncbi:hypothetical protein D3C78_1683850 [compost metagenome]
MLLITGQHIDLREPNLRILSDIAQNLQEMLCHPSDRLMLEQSRTVFEADDQLVIRFGSLKR